MAPRQDDDPKSFLSRWSQRKRAAEEEAPETEDSQAAVPGGPEAAEDSETVDPKDLPDIESLDASSDYSVFLKKGVPAGLKRKALNKLWQTDPAFRHICMLDDYNLDYTDAAMVVPNLKTLFQVGRGMVLPEDEAADAAKAAEQAAAEARGEVGSGDALPGDAETPGPEAAAQDSLAAAETGAAPADAPPTQRRPRARMPGTPVVPATANRGSAAAVSGRAGAPPKGERSARQRRWGDPGEV